MNNQMLKSNGLIDLSQNDMQIIKSNYENNLTHLDVLKQRHSSLSVFQNLMFQIRKTCKKENKKLYKKLQEETKEAIKDFRFTEYFDEISSFKSSKNQFVMIGLEVDYKVQPTIIESSFNNKNLNKMLKDSSFRRFVELCLFTISFVKYKEKELQIVGLNESGIEDLKVELRDTFSIFSLYWLLNTKTENITPLKIRNILSYFEREVSPTYIHVFNTTEKQTEFLEQIRTGVKVMKEKNTNPSNNSSYNKKDTFNVNDFLENRIVIKYITGQNGKHLEHKSPIEHTRKGHYRTLKNGKTIFIESMTINEGRVA